MAIASCSSMTTGPPRWIGDTVRGRMAPTEATRRSSSRRVEGVLVSRNPLLPRDHAEAVALFRASIVGAIVQRELSRGELALALRAAAASRYRPPGSRVAKQFSIATVERWFYAYRRGGLEA